MATLPPMANMPDPEGLLQTTLVALRRLLATSISKAAGPCKHGSLSVWASCSGNDRSFPSDEMAQSQGGNLERQQPLFPRLENSPDPVVKMAAKTFLLRDTFAGTDVVIMVATPQARRSRT